MTTSEEELREISDRLVRTRDRIELRITKDTDALHASEAKGQSAGLGWAINTIEVYIQAHREHR